MQPWILKQCESLHEVLEVRCPRAVRLVHVSWGVPKIDNSKFQVLKPLEVTSRTELKFLPVKLPKAHLPLGLLERCLQLQELLEEGFDVLVLLILPSANVVATQDRVFPHYVPNSSIKHSKSDSKDRSQEIL
jgi:hypothetical protein